MEGLHHIAISMIIIIFGFFLFHDIKQKRSNPNFPTLLITLGIAFTFLGIAIGLKDFDINKTIESLPILINGIKTAFWGSLAGIIGAIFLKIFGIIYFKEDEVLSKEESQIQKFYQEHTESLRLQQVQHEAFLELSKQQHLELLQLTRSQHHELLSAHNNLANNENMVQLHQSVNNIYHLLVNLNNLSEQRNNEAQENLQHNFGKIFDHQDKIFNSQVYELKSLQHEVRESAKQQAQTAAQVVTHALQDAVTNLNSGLINHLGQNFADFHISMGKIIDWQKQYQAHVESQTQHYQTSAEQLTYIQQNFEKFIEISKQVLEIPKQFNVFLESASEFEQLAEHINHSLNHLEGQSAQIGQHLDTYYATIEQKNQQLLNSLQLPNQILSELHQQTQNIAQDMQKMQQHIRLTFSEMRENLAKELHDLQKNQQDNLQEALNESLISFARQMGSISEKFAQDYEPITNNIKQMMQHIERANISSTNTQNFTIKR